MRLALLLAAAASFAAAEEAPRRELPRINVGGIVNAASNLPAPQNFVSPGAIISIYGTGLALETREAGPGDGMEGFLPRTLAGVRVNFGSIPAALFYVSPLQINAQVPAELAPGDWEVQVKLDIMSASEPVTVRPYSPGIFPVARHTDGTLVSRQAPARVGEYILFFGTGFGPTRRLLLTGQLAPLEPMRLDKPIEARIGDITLAAEDVYYAGTAPGYAGLDQFNLRIPAAAPAGDLEVLVKIVDSWSQPGFRIPVVR